MPVPDEDHRDRLDPQLPYPPVAQSPPPHPPVPVLLLQLLSLAHPVNCSPFAFGSSYRKQHFNRPHRPDSREGFRLKFCRLAVLIEIGKEPLQPRRATKGAPAGAVSAQQLGLVAGADPTAKLSRQVADEVTEVDPLLRGEIEQQPGTVELLCSTRTSFIANLRSLTFIRPIQYASRSRCCCLRRVATSCCDAGRNTRLDEPASSGTERVTVPYPYWSPRATTTAYCHPTAGTPAGRITIRLACRWAASTG